MSFNILEFVGKRYDIRKLERKCNFINCNRKPGKEILIYEFDIRTGKKKELLSLYLCSEHFIVARNTLIEDLKKTGNMEGKKINIKVFDTGIITH